MKIIKIFKQTISDGPGIRYSIYFSGCSHKCYKCHNQASWDPSKGRTLDEVFFDEIINEINSNPMLDGISLSGGDPFYNPSELLVFLKKLRNNTSLNLWVYTGYLIEELLENDITRECLNYIDVLVDGKFEYDKFDPELLYRGSTNQRIIAVNDFINNYNKTK